jgi:hypothetical protein
VEKIGDICSGKISDVTGMLMICMVAKKLLSRVAQSIIRATVITFSGEGKLTVRRIRHGYV